MTTAEEFLEHHGVKGMKWGIRRPRGKDGTVTGHTTSTKPAAHELSDEDLKKFISRMELEKKYTDLVNPKKPAEKSGSAEFIKKHANTLVGIAVSTAGTHAMNQALKKATGTKK